MPSLFFAADTKFAIVLSSAAGTCQVTNSPVDLGTFSFYQDGAAFQDLGGGWSRLSDGPTGIADLQFETIASNDALVHTQQYLGDARGVRLVSGKGPFLGNNGSAELYDPATNESVTRPIGRAEATRTATLLNSGQVLVTGGVDFSTPFPQPALATAELYDPALDRFVAVAAPMTTTRIEHRAVLLTDGRVLITGGVQTGTTRCSTARKSTIR